MKKFAYFLFTALTFIPVVSSAETIFYKNNNEPITDSEHEVLYKIKLQYQFPMSTRYSWECPDNEIEVIQQEIDKKLPNSGINVVFLPTTLYELLFIHFVETNKNNLEDATGGLLSYQVGRSYSGYAVSESYKHAEDVHLLKELKECHFIFNNYVVHFLKERGVILSEAIPAHILTNILSDSSVLHAVNQFFNRNFMDRVTNFFFNKVQNLARDIERVILQEQEAHNNNKFLLYRGTNTIEKYQGHIQSLSFGSSLFSGCFFEQGATAGYGLFFIKGATPYLYWLQCNYGYVLPVDKKDYRLGNPENLFYIPPIMTIVGMLGQGEFFHPRSKVLIDSNNSRIGGFPKNITRDSIPYALHTTTDNYQQIFTYIQKNHVVMKKNMNFLPQLGIAVAGVTVLYVLMCKQLAGTICVSISRKIAVA
jgi:hypothetical protein